jgi:hypothetical protein
MKTNDFIRQLLKVAKTQQVILKRLAQKATIQQQIMDLVRKVADSTPSIGPGHMLKITKLKFTPTSKDKSIVMEENWMAHVSFDPKLSPQQSNDFINAFSQASSQLPTQVSIVIN